MAKKTGLASPEELLTRLREKPFPRCMLCRKLQRAHGLFQVEEHTALLCAEHGFAAGAKLIRSLSTNYTPPNTEPKPCTTIQLRGMAKPLEVPLGMTASQFLHTLHTVTHKETNNGTGQ